MGTDLWPDADRMDRLRRRLRSRDSRAQAFIASGEAMALAILARPDEPVEAQGLAPLPQWAEDLADGMVGSLLLVVDDTVDDASPAERVRLSIAAAVLSVVRPRAESGCDAAVDTWMGWGGSEPTAETDDATLFGWVLLCLLRRNGPAALRAVRAFSGDDGVGLILQDWTMSVLLSEPLLREAQSFHQLRTHLAHEGARPSHLLLAALVVQTGAGLGRHGVSRWLDAIAAELATTGTSRCTPVPPAHPF